MFIRGSGSGQEFKRNDQSFYRGIVVKNNDPLRLNRVKVYISELSNQPYENWFENHDEINVKTPGVNNVGDNWMDTAVFEEIANNIPWAEPCFPLFGEGGGSRYFEQEKIATISDSNYIEGFQILNDKSPTIETGGFSPAFLYENMGTAVSDSFSNPIDNLSGQCNPYSFAYKPSKHVNKAKGMFSIPEVGTKVWVFHWLGELNYPIYFGIMHDSRELSLMNDTNNAIKSSPTYPVDFEN
jgi:hypothetical protein